MIANFIDFIRQDLFKTESFIPLHVPTFNGKEKENLINCIDTTFVSSVGAFVDQFEKDLAEYIGCKKAVVTVNGTSALHMSMLVVGVEAGDEVITQPLTFIATANAINYTGADPIFLDVDKDTMGLSPIALSNFLKENTKQEGGQCINKTTGKRIAACVPMHTFGFPCRIDEIALICEEHNIPLVEDAAESLGTTYKGKQTGTFGKMSAISFNGNKIITTGGGGAIVTNNEELAAKAKHITTQAKMPHPWEYEHDMIGYNYRMPNVNAALGCAQLELLPEYIANKKLTYEKYQAFATANNWTIAKGIKNSVPNYWLTCLILNNREERDDFLKFSNENKVMSRPIWKLMNKLSMFEHCQTDALENANWLEDRVVNLPSSVIL